MRSFRRDCRGQVIVVTALLVAVILLTTAMYVIETQKSTPTIQESTGVPIDSYRTAVKSTLVSALANVSGGGNSAILASDLTELKTIILARSYESQLTLTYNLLSSGGYTDGLRVYWGSSGDGLSSAYATVSCSSSSYSGGSEVSYIVNVTSRVHMNGNYMQLNETHKQVNLLIELSDESGPELAHSVTLSYLNASSWVLADSPSITDFGNGTYTATFLAQTGQIDEPLDVSTVCLDARGISVGANVTCSRVT